MTFTVEHLPVDVTYNPLKHPELRFCGAKITADWTYYVYEVPTNPLVKYSGLEWVDVALRHGFKNASGDDYCEFTTTINNVDLIAAAVVRKLTKENTSESEKPNPSKDGSV